MSEPCSFCDKESVYGGTQYRYCEYHYGFIAGAMKVYEKINGMSWQEAQKEAFKLVRGIFY